MLHPFLIQTVEMLWKEQGGTFIISFEAANTCRFHQGSIFLSIDKSTKQIYMAGKIRENLQETGGMRRGETNNGNRCVCCKTVVAKSEQQAYENPCSGRGSVSVYHKGQIYRGRERFHLQKMDKCRQSPPGARERC